MFSSRAIESGVLTHVVLRELEVSVLCYKTSQPSVWKVKFIIDH